MNNLKKKNNLKKILGIACTISVGVGVYTAIKNEKEILSKDNKLEEKQKNKNQAKNNVENDKVRLYKDRIKEPIDASISTMFLLLLSPLFAVISILIKLTSKGPIFFKQERLGKGEEVFKIYKFRTMVDNAENMGDGIKIKTKKDNRITPVGRVLRETSLDELPQLINVVKGDMALVGPRPPVTYHPYKKGEYGKRKAHRFDVKPGITGLAQVEIRNQRPWDDRIEYDLKYVDRISFKEDIKILVKTIKVILRLDR